MAAGRRHLCYHVVSSTRRATICEPPPAPTRHQIVIADHHNIGDGQSAQTRGRRRTDSRTTSARHRATSIRSSLMNYSAVTAAAAAVLVAHPPARPPSRWRGPSSSAVRSVAGPTRSAAVPRRKEAASTSLDNSNVEPECRNFTVAGTETASSSSSSSSCLYQAVTTRTCRHIQRADETIKHT